MYSAAQLALKYTRYYLTASNSKGHGIHSPFVFNFIQNILNDNKVYPAYKAVEQQRKKLLADKRVLTIQDFGAGSSATASSQRAVAAIALTALKPLKYAQLLYRIVNYYRPVNIIELGTSLGVTACYLSLASPPSTVLTLEGSPEVAEIAQQQFDQLGLGNVHRFVGNFDGILPSVLTRVDRADLIFFDGNHRATPTRHYFELTLAKATNDSIFIFDDIHWSKEMEDAWRYIKFHEAVRCTIDLFFFGIVLFRQEFKAKQDFTIRF